MRLLLDENLSLRLIGRLSSLFSELIHVSAVGLQRASDRAIWNWAQTNQFSVITTDSDFADLSRELGWPPKIVFLENCNFPLSIIEAILRGNAVRISAFLETDNVGLLTLRR